MTTPLSWGHFIVSLITFAAALFIYLWFLDGPVAPVADGLRYAGYVVNLNLHGVFALSSGAVDQVGEPSRANAPLYMVVVAAVSWLDAGLRDTLVCRVGNTASCPLDIASLYALNAVFGGLAATISTILAWRFTASMLIAWGTGILVLSAIVSLEYGTTLGPENAILPAFFALSLALDTYWKTRSWQAVFMAGALVGTLALIRPSYQYLIYGLVLGFAIYGALHRDGRGILALVAGSALVVTPWAIRNWVHFGDPALSGGQYGEIIIAQRFAYNAMTWGQWAVSFLYWLPDFGDKASEALFPPQLYAPLGLGPGTFFETAITDVYEASRERVGDANVMRDLITTHVFGEPWKYAAVTASLAWRGLFVAKYFGLIGIVCTMVVLPRGGWRFALLLMPMVFMVGFHAAISISIERYNLFLVAALRAGYCMGGGGWHGTCACVGIGYGVPAWPVVSRYWGWWSGSLSRGRCRTSLRELTVVWWLWQLSCC